MGGCIFCDIVNGKAEATVVWHDELVCAFLDIQPINAGHIDIVPNAHAANLAALPANTGAHMFQVAQRMAAALRASGLPCEGVNMFLADGEAAMQEVFHVHLHVFPRAAGDGFGLTFGDDYFSRPSRPTLDAASRKIRAVIGTDPGYDVAGGGFRRNEQGRAPFQILVLPYRESSQGIDYAVFRRADAQYWQFIAGGGENSELPIEAARREANEEAGIPFDSHLFPLDSQNTVPVLELAGSLRWGPDVLVVPEFTFAVHAGDRDLRIGPEHTEYRWVDYETCREMLHWDSNRNALHELNHRVTHRMVPGSNNSR